MIIDPDIDGRLSYSTRLESPSLHWQNPRALEPFKPITRSRLGSEFRARLSRFLGFVQGLANHYYSIVVGDSHACHGSIDLPGRIEAAWGNMGDGGGGAWALGNGMEWKHTPTQLL